ncbi:MAG TPA: PssE/Cps14G family polysaccharide biosynthesis glycosyltransferase [Anaerolineae bacterium]|nr:PssE/Cps14G family polysaccharide biosynthesis glycosyltransferase [Anaerolineae bacterium]HMR64045.1 PssE/Cps14G family polysaccharide biosynthesis glycosyltransferase [Anaerolineae bacterium]
MSQPLQVFVTVGSTDFDALTQTVDQLAPELNLQGHMQIGHGRYCPQHLPYFHFCRSLTSYYTQASVVIAHGGLATTMEVLKLGRPLVSVSNPDRYDNHQADLLAAMAAENYLIWCQNLDELALAIHSSQTTSLQPYPAPECHIHLVIHQYLDQLKKEPSYRWFNKVMRNL